MLLLEFNGMKTSWYCADWVKLCWEAELRPSADVT